MSKARLLEAVSRLDVNASKRLLTEQPRLLSVTNKRGLGLLHLACSADAARLGVPSRRALELVEFLLDQDIDVNSTFVVDGYPCNSVFFATRGKNLKLIEYLVKKGASPRGLFAAGYWENLPMLKLLIQLGADVDECAGDETPFLHCWKCARFKSARVLMDAGANVNFQDSKGRTALHFSLDKKHDVRRFKLLLDYGANPGLHDTIGVSPRLRAFRMRDKRYFRALKNTHNRSPGPA